MIFSKFSKKNGGPANYCKGNKFLLTVNYRPCRLPYFSIIFKPGACGGMACSKFGHWNLGKQYFVYLVTNKFQNKKGSQLIVRVLSEGLKSSLSPATKLKYAHPLLSTDKKLLRNCKGNLLSVTTAQFIFYMKTDAEIARYIRLEAERVGAFHPDSLPYHPHFLIIQCYVTTCPVA